MNLRPYKRSTSARGERGLAVRALPSLAGALSLSLGLLLGGCATPLPHPEVEEAWRVGPLVESQRTQGGDTLLAVRPFYSRETNATNAPVRHVNEDYLWPVGRAVSNDERYNWRFLCFYGNGGDADEPVLEEDEPYRFRLFPIYFSGRTREGEEYRAVFPLGGTIRGFLLSDEIEFYLFPFYARGRRGDVEMKTICWPFYLTRHGRNVDQFRLWPFYGDRVHRQRAQTDETSFILWPFWTSLSTHGKAVNGSGFVLFPIYGHSRFQRARRGTIESWSVLPPLFSYTRGDDGYRRLHAPWPIVRQLDQDDLHARHLWPFYGSVTNENSRRTYALWPLFSVHSGSNEIGSVTISHLPAPFFYRAAGTFYVPPPGATNGAERIERERSYTRVWPLFSHRDNEGGTFTRFPELSLWSTSEAIERNWAPLWSLYTRRHQAATGRTGHDVLWGLFSREYGEGYSKTALWPFFSRKREGDSWRWSILGGLLGREGDDEGSSWRFLWFLGGADGPSPSRAPGPARPLPDNPNNEAILP